MPQTGAVRHLLADPHGSALAFSFQLSSVINHEVKDVELNIEAEGNKRFEGPGQPRCVAVAVVGKGLYFSFLLKMKLRAGISATLPL